MKYKVLNENESKACVKVSDLLEDTALESTETIDIVIKIVEGILNNLEPDECGNLVNIHPLMTRIHGLTGDDNNMVFRDGMFSTYVKTNASLIRNYEAFREKEIDVDSLNIDKIFDRDINWDYNTVIRLYLVVEDLGFLIKDDEESNIQYKNLRDILVKILSDFGNRLVKDRMNEEFGKKDKSDRRYYDKNKYNNFTYNDVLFKLQYIDPSINLDLLEHYKNINKIMSLPSVNTIHKYSGVLLSNLIIMSTDDMTDDAEDIANKLPDEVISIIKEIAKSTDIIGLIEQLSVILESLGRDLKFLIGERYDKLIDVIDYVCAVK